MCSDLADPLTTLGCAILLVTAASKTARCWLWFSPAAPPFPLCLPSLPVPQPPLPGVAPDPAPLLMALELWRVWVLLAASMLIDVGCMLAALLSWNSTVLTATSRLRHIPGNVIASSAMSVVCKLGMALLTDGLTTTRSTWHEFELHGHRA